MVIALASTQWIRRDGTAYPRYAWFRMYLEPTCSLEARNDLDHEDELTWYPVLIRYLW